MGAGDGDPESQPHQLAQQLRARDDRNVPAARGRQLGVVRARSRREHDDVDIADVLGPVPDVNVHTERRQSVRCL